MTSLAATNRIVRGATAAVSNVAVIENSDFTLKLDNPKVQSVSTMTFAPDGKLVLADWKSNALHTVALPSIEAHESGSFNL
jgi:hypothetical protein